ncbi:threonylcarbamoyl-AMP synthase [Candidatus Microgenomates bacterium]|nr:threonylcarbamoyl-AMP synthase [Candidatus Microgenomates bacterium]
MIIKKAVKILKQGGIVIFPTDTAYGIGCRIDDKKAVERLFKIRKKPKTQAVPVLVSSIEMAENYLLAFGNKIRDLMKKHWPGGLTIIYSCQTKKIPLLVRGGGENLGVRVPDHQIPLLLIKELGMPMIGTSANFHGEKTAYCFEDLNQELIKKVDYVIKGECQKGKASTVIDCSKKPWKVLRQGLVKIAT